MQTKHYQILCLISITLILSACAYTQQFISKAEQAEIENNMAESQLTSVEKYFGKAPLSTAYRFSFKGSDNDSISLFFTLHEGSFSSSTLRYRINNNFRTERTLQDKDLQLYSVFENTLPKPDDIAWHSVNQLHVDNAEENYQAMLEFIREKLRDT